ncbi:GNAT family N-acetyltransferase [Actibacterium sp. 188UL27-1]|uniref:GNAT family N-acetyltransferase n=1 Tax=Actibacterium sp. 188UL27-1 TaxID=2786961 RepID=UPI001958D318|nr:GNAT family N-acetyltransferase [Actibacterium sp. 188UL27-1]MBM7068664.1 GNAT family N-acetyltransferase [Actibacterium sp. 188UL27-1]
MIGYRHATLAELALILDWAAAEGWNPGLDDANAFYAADREGFFVAVDQVYHPVAAISVVNHNDDFAFLGLYIVRQEYRGKGIGLALWSHAIAHAGPSCVGLDGVEAQQQNYITSGFTKVGRTTRYSGQVEQVDDIHVSPADPHDIPKLIAQETTASGTAKHAYLTAWFTQTDHCVTLVCKEGEAIKGFCTIRRCRDGAKIGPLVADGTEITHRLIKHAATAFDNSIIIDVPETSTSLIAVCKNHGLTAGFKTARMYRGTCKLPGHDIYAVASLELG